PQPPPITLHYDLRGGEDAAFVDSARGFAPPDSGGRRVVDDTATVYVSRTLDSPLDLVLTASTPPATSPARLTVRVGRESRTVVERGSDQSDTLAFSGSPKAQLIRFETADTAAGRKRGGETSIAHAPPVHIRTLTISLRWCVSETGVGRRGPPFRGARVRSN